MPRKPATADDGGTYDFRGEAPPPHADAQRPSADLLLWAYCRTLFPMVDPDSGQVEWFSPDPRGVIPLDPPHAFRVPRNLAREVRRGRFAIRCDRAFQEVFKACATARSETNVSWMNEQLAEAYAELFERGFAHSIEAWLDERLVGGLYGVHIGAAFFGESMFSRPDLGGSNASKVCLVHLVNWLRRRGFTLLDTQFWHEHLDQFGCVEISAAEYERQLREAVGRTVEWGEFRTGAG